MDLGCGSGLSTRLISQEFTPNYLAAFDFMPEQIELAKNRNIKADFFVGDTANIDIQDSSFNAVFVTGVLHHIPEWKKALKEIYRILKKDGILFIEEPSKTLLFLVDIIKYEHLEETKTFWDSFEKELKNTWFNILSKKTILLCLGQSFLLKK